MDRPRTVRDLAEELGEELGADGRGRWRLELSYVDGRFTTWYRHEERIPAEVLERPLRGRGDSDGI